MKQTDIMFRSMIIAFVMIGTLGFAAATTYDSNVTLENKNGNPNWNTVPDGISAIVYYNSVGDEFKWNAIGTAELNNTEYSLIYYADYPNRFNKYGGDNPGALIGTMKTDSVGAFDKSGSTELNMNLPSSPDANMNISENNYCEAPDNYTHCTGAKLWMVPSVYYDADAKKVKAAGWQNQAYFLFETDLIWYDDCDDFYEGEPANATFSIGDAFGNATIPITITNGTNVGAVEIVLYYNASLVTVTEVLNGEMDSTYSTIGTGQVTIGTAQSSGAGLSGDFTLASLNVTPVGTEAYNITMSVTTFRDATPCGRDMPYDIADGDGSPYLNGDVNGDGLVDMFDVMYLAKHIGGASGFGDIIEVAADVDGSGIIDVADISYLAKHIIGYPGYETLK